MRIINTILLCSMFSLAISACGGSSKKPPSAPSGTVKGGTNQSASAAKSAGDKSGPTAKSNQSSATNQGTETDDGTACDSSDDGVAFCADDATVWFCSGGNWYQLDCTSLDPDAECGEDSLTVDCYSPD
jgi:hypothetical protein